MYARSWHSLEPYGNPTLAASHKSRQSGRTVDEKLMHTRPVRRNLEVTDEVLDGSRGLATTLGVEGAAA